MVNHLFMAGIVAFFVVQFYAALRSHWPDAPRWLAVVLFAAVLMGFVIVTM